MLKLFLFAWLLTNAGLNQSKLNLPLQNGTIVAYKNDSGMGVEILPTDNFEVKSCSDATIHFAALMDFNKRTLVIARKDSIDFIYVLDSSFVVKGQKISKGMVIGKLSDINKEQEPLIFYVKVEGKDVNPRHYMTYVNE